ncbi:MAG TPA: hypothetical protein VK188_04445 [Holophaga sp.]|nr:hypothetical protein [Holophaga sp.]
MSYVLETVCIGVLLVVAVSVVSLLGQVKRTAAGLERFLTESRQDLARIAQDIHATRERLDGLASSAQAALDDIGCLTQSLGLAGRTLKAVEVWALKLLGGLGRGFFQGSGP